VTRTNKENLPHAAFHNVFMRGKPSFTSTTKIRSMHFPPASRPELIFYQVYERHTSMKYKMRPPRV
jgi:hypothetical protein